VEAFTSPNLLIHSRGTCKYSLHSRNGDDVSDAVDLLAMNERIFPSAIGVIFVNEIIKLKRKLKDNKTVLVDSCLSEDRDSADCATR